MWRDPGWAVPSFFPGLAPWAVLHGPCRAGLELLSHPAIKTIIPRHLPARCRTTKSPQGLRPGIFCATLSGLQCGAIPGGRPPSFFPGFAPWAVLHGPCRAGLELPSHPAIKTIIPRHLPGRRRAAKSPQGLRPGLSCTALAGPALSFYRTRRSKPLSRGVCPAGVAPRNLPQGLRNGITRTAPFQGQPCRRAPSLCRLELREIREKLPDFAISPDGTLPRKSISYYFA